MTKLRVGITTLIGLFASFSVFAQEVGIDEKINLAIKPFADAVAGAVFFSFPVAGVQIPFVLRPPEMKKRPIQPLDRQMA